MYTNGVKQIANQLRNVECKSTDILPIIVSLPGHANGLLIRKEHAPNSKYVNEYVMEYFEPHGFEDGVGWVHQSITKQLEQLAHDLSNELNVPVRLIEMEKSCPYGIQRLENDYQQKFGKQYAGYCASHTLFVLEMRLIYPSLSSKQIMKHILRILGTTPDEQGANMLTFIQKYAINLARHTRAYIRDAPSFELPCKDISAHHKKGHLSLPDDKRIVTKSQIRAYINVLWMFMKPDAFPNFLSMYCEIAGVETGLKEKASTSSSSPRQTSSPKDLAPTIINGGKSTDTKYVVYEGRRYAVRKSMKRLCIIQKKQTIFLKDIRGRYKYA